MLCLLFPQLKIENCIIFSDTTCISQCNNKNFPFQFINDYIYVSKKFKFITFIISSINFQLF